MTLPNSVLLLLAASAAALAGDAKSPVPAATGDWEFSLSAGPAWRQSGTLDFSGGSRSAGAVIPSFVGNDALVTPAIGAEDQIGDRFYDDGFVRTDPSTAIDGFTNFWGYQNASQVGGDDISFHATGFQSIRGDTLTRGTAPSFDRHEQGIAPVIQFDGSYRHGIAGIRPGFSASVSWVPVKLNRRWSDFALAQVRDDFRHDWTDVYNLGGFGDFIPSAPYAGTPAGPGFVLENIPDLRDFNSVQIGSENALLTNTVSTRFRADHATISVGPTLEHRVAESWSVQAGIGISLHWLHWSATQTETLNVTRDSGTTGFARWDDSSSGNKILSGIYLQIGTEWTPKDQAWSIKSLLRTDLGNSFSKQIGPSRVTYDTDGLTAAVMVSHTL